MNWKWTDFPKKWIYSPKTFFEIGDNVAHIEIGSFHASCGDILFFFEASSSLNYLNDIYDSLYPDEVLFGRIPEKYNDIESMKIFVENFVNKATALKAFY